MNNDEYYIKKTFKLARQGISHVSPNPLVGCVIVKNGKIIAKGYHHKFGEKHAEIDALDKIKGKAKGATLYVNLEPCSHHGKTPPCTDRIIEEEISKVVIAILDPNPKISGNGIKKLKEASIEVVSGILEKEAKELNEKFIYSIQNKKSYLMLKLALSKDLFLAPKNKKRIQITNEKQNKEVHKLRSEYDAVLIGSGTVINDNPLLTTRLIKGRNPYRIILDRTKSLDLKKYHLFNDEFKKLTMVISSSNYENKKYDEYLKKQNIKQIYIYEKDNKLDINELMKKLYKLNIGSVMCEGGLALSKHIIENKLVLCHLVK
jgi:diaminohydroxyphosphoribosylaminopyrimidine deaminase / 5-amino-6-(5-phosphoribosylamino)uracil reductase